MKAAVACECLMDLVTCDETAHIFSHITSHSAFVCAPVLFADAIVGG